MKSSTAQMATAFLVVLLVAALAFLGSRGGKDTTGREASSVITEEVTSPSSEVSLIEVGNRGPLGGVAGLRYGVGGRVRLIVQGQTDDEVHVHGYDLTASLAPGRPAELSFPSTTEGVFKVELERSGIQIARLTIHKRAGRPPVPGGS